MATKQKTKPNTSARKRFLSHNDRRALVWYFEVVLENAAPASLPKLLWKKGKKAEEEDRPPEPTMHVKASAKNGAKAKAEAEDHMVDLVDEISEARKVRAVLDRLLADNAQRMPHGSFTVGQEYIIRLHEAYVRPTHLMVSTKKVLFDGKKVSEGLLLCADGERKVIKLRGGGAIQAKNLKLAGFPPDAIPGLEALFGDGKRAAEHELEEASRAFELAKRAARVSFARPEKPRRRLVLKAEAARLMGISRTEVDRKIKAGQLPTERHAGRDMVLVEDDPA
jgi:predicted DNA-binding transcriptional regulator AlpA